MKLSSNLLKFQQSFLTETSPNLKKVWLCFIHKSFGELGWNLWKRLKLKFFPPKQCFKFNSLLDHKKFHSLSKCTTKFLHHLQAFLSLSQWKSPNSSSLPFFFELHKNERFMKYESWEKNLAQYFETDKFTPKMDFTVSWLHSKAVYFLINRSPRKIPQHFSAQFLYRFQWNARET